MRLSRLYRRRQFAPEPDRDGGFVEESASSVEHAPLRQTFSDDDGSPDALPRRRRRPAPPAIPQDEGTTDAPRPVPPRAESFFKQPPKRRPSRSARRARKRFGSLTQWTAFALSAAVLAVCAFHLGGYALDYFRSIRLSAQAKTAYRSAATPAPESSPVSAPFPALEPTQGPTSLLQKRAAEALASAQSASGAQEVSAAQLAPDSAQTPSPDATLPPVPYPENPYNRVSGSFAALHRQNRDIVGFLSLEGLLDEAVVQRDNDYYLRRDYLGYHNANGAIFLDQSCRLTTRPYTLTLYGHNMKTGAMFGCLRNYEDLSFYHKNPFVTFDTIYEEGRYVIFSVATVSLDPASTAFSEFFSLESCTASKREKVLGDLRRLSLFTCPVDVAVDDQLLLLVTCVDNDDERRIVAARRFRSGETEGGLFAQVHTAARK